MFRVLVLLCMFLVPSTVFGGGYADMEGVTATCDRPPVLVLRGKGNRVVYIDSSQINFVDSSAVVKAAKVELRWNDNVVFAKFAGTRAESAVAKRDAFLELFEKCVSGSVYGHGIQVE